MVNNLTKPPLYAIRTYYENARLNIIHTYKYDKFSLSSKDSFFYVVRISVDIIGVNNKPMLQANILLPLTSVPFILTFLIHRQQLRRMLLKTIDKLVQKHILRHEYRRAIAGTLFPQTFLGKKPQNQRPGNNPLRETHRKNNRILEKLQRAIP